VAARVLRETRMMKTETQHTVTQESVTILDEPPNMMLAINQSPEDGTPTLREKSIQAHTDYISEKAATAITYLSLQSGGEVSLWLDFNPFSATVEDRAFVEDLVSFVQAYARKHPTVPKKVDDK